MDILPTCVDKKAPYTMVNGLVWHKIPYTDDYAINPTDIACQAIRGNKNAIEWLIMSMQTSGAYRHNYDIPYYGVNAPWTGALTQALAVMALLKHNELALAHRACDYMIRYCYKGGLFYEKPGVFILNGHMFCVLALKEMIKHGYNYTKEFDMSETITRWRLDKYTMKNGWTIYDETGIPCTKFYHALHVLLIEELYDMTNKGIYSGFWIEWLFAKEPKIKRLLCIAKKNGIKTFAIYLKRRKWLKDVD